MLHWLLSFRKGHICSSARRGQCLRQIHGSVDRFAQTIATYRIPNHATKRSWPVFSFPRSVHRLTMLWMIHRQSPSKETEKLDLLEFTWQTVKSVQVFRDIQSAQMTGMEPAYCRAASAARGGSHRQKHSNAEEVRTQWHESFTSVQTQSRCFTCRLLCRLTQQVNCNVTIAPC